MLISFERDLNLCNHATLAMFDQFFTNVCTFAIIEKTKNE